MIIKHAEDVQQDRLLHELDSGIIDLWTNSSSDVNILRLQRGPKLLKFVSFKNNKLIFFINENKNTDTINIKLDGKLYPVYVNGNNAPPDYLKNGLYGIYKVHNKFNLISIGNDNKNNNTDLIVETLDIFLSSIKGAEDAIANLKEKIK